MHCRIPAAALSLATLAMASACTPAPSPSPSGPVIVATGPTASPSPLCLFESGGTPSPCTQAQFDELASKDALYREAEQVYRKYLAEDERISRSGSLITPDLVVLLGGKMAITAPISYQKTHDAGVRLEGLVQVRFVRRHPGEDLGDSQVALLSCVDATEADVIAHGNSVAKGRKVRAVNIFGLENGSLKLVDVRGQVGVSVC